jgi:hypothetical protein
MEDLGLPMNACLDLSFVFISSWHLEQTGLLTFDVQTMTVTAIDKGVNHS